MNLMLHAHMANAGSEKRVPIKVADALAADPGERFDVLLANPPFGKKSSTTIVDDLEAALEKFRLIAAELNSSDASGENGSNSVIADQPK